MRERFEKRLWSIARERALYGGFLFSDEMRKLLDGLIRSAAERMEREGRLDDARSQFEAKSNMMKLVDLMVEEGRRSEENTESLELSKGNLERAKRKLCSLWPYF